MQRIAIFLVLIFALAFPGGQAMAGRIGVASVVKNDVSGSAAVPFEWLSVVTIRGEPRCTPALRCLMELPGPHGYPGPHEQRNPNPIPDRVRRPIGRRAVAAVGL